jgi:hypothetical protein
VDTLAWLRAHGDWVKGEGPELTLFAPAFLRLENARRGQVDLKAALAGLPIERAKLVNVPQCLSGRAEPATVRFLATEELLREVEDVPAHARHYFFARNPRAPRRGPTARRRLSQHLGSTPGRA